MSDIASLWRRRVRRRQAAAALAITLAAASGARAQQPAPPPAGQVSDEFAPRIVPQTPPTADLARLYPQSWTTYAAGPGRTAVSALPEPAPQNLRDGVRRAFAAIRAGDGTRVG